MMDSIPSAARFVRGFQSLYARILLVVGVALLPAFGFLVYSEHEGALIRQQFMEDEALRLTALVNAEQLRIFESAEQILDLVIASPQGTRSSACDRLAADIVHIQPRYAAVAVIGPDGQIGCRAARSSTTMAAFEPAYRLALQDDGLFIGEYIAATALQPATIGFAKRFHDADGAIAGVAALSLDVAWLQDRFKRTPLPPGAEAMIADRNGIILARTAEAAGFAGASIPADSRWILRGDALRLVSIAGADGHSRLAVYAPLGLEPKGVFIDVSLDREVAFVSMTRTNRVGEVLLVGGALLGLLLTILIGSRLIRRPFNRLLAAAQAWRAGNLATRTGMGAELGEFGRLAAAFDQMAETLEHRDRALRLLRDNLEARVTQEVAARNTAQARATQAERTQALGLLAGGIAHDFNNVLQTIVGATHLIENRPGDEAANRRLARLAISAAERGEAITSRLLSFNHKTELRAESLDVAPLLGGLREILSHTLGAAIGVSVQTEPRLAILADHRQLETVLVNLATNARDAMPKGGQLLFRAEAEADAAEGVPAPSNLRPGRYIRISVTDTGAGMAAATLARVGEPFFTTKKNGDGTGLGLSLAREFAEKSDGAMAIHSAPGQGTTVTLWLPAARAATADAAGVVLQPHAAAHEAPAALAHGRARVLVVDDEEMIRELIGEQLRDAGYDTLTAAGGAAALELLDNCEPVQLLVSDLSMPAMDGVALIQAAQLRLPGLPTILLTGYAGAGVADALRKAIRGPHALLRKPVTGIELVDQIQALLAGQQVPLQPTSLH
ncbi:ATP-binding protein [Rhodopseudomonas palustris]